MSNTPPVISPQPPLKVGNWYRQMARASWLAPLFGIVTNIMLMVGTTLEKSDPVRTVSGAVFILGGLALGIIALFGVRKHGRPKILVPALIGIGINLFFIVTAGLSVLHLMKMRAHLLPVVHSPAARLLKDDRLRFSMDIPEGFRDFPEGKTKPSTEYVFVKDLPDGGGTRLVIVVERLNGIIPKNAQPMKAEDIRKRVPPGFTVDVTKKNWRGLKVEAIVGSTQVYGERAASCSVQVPLVPWAIQLGVSGPESKRPEIEHLADALLASLEGKTNW